MRNSEIQVLANHIIAKSESITRFIVAIAGPPASGKSTLAEKLCVLINQQTSSEVSEVIPMDGFHLDNSALDKLGLRHRKGAENTFNSDGFVKMIKDLDKNDEAVSIPLFDRKSDAIIPNAKVISLNKSILIVEGNYLLLNKKPWSNLHTVYDYKVLLNPSIEIIKDRLIKRWIDNGYDNKGATNRALSNDIPNAEYVLEHSLSADLIIQ